MKDKFSILVFSILTFLSSQVLGGYDCSATFTFSGYAGTEALENFPVLIRLSEDSPKGFSKHQLQADFKDLEFFSGETSLEYEIEKLSPDETTYVWVRVPLLTKDTVITAKWGDKTASSAPVTAGASSLWSSAGYAGVWHFAEESGTAYDSSGNALHAEVEGAAVEEMVSYKNGAAGPGRFLTTSSKVNRFSVPSSDALDVGSNFTFTVWLRCPGATLPGNWRIAGHKRSYSSANGWEVQGYDKWELTQRGSSSDGLFSNVDTCAAQWAQYTFVYDGENSKFRTYSNGALVKEGDFAPVVDNDEPLCFGSTEYETKVANYAIYDECRLSTERLSADRIKADYDAVNSTSFYEASAVTISGSMSDFTVVVGDSRAGAVSPAAGSMNLSDGETVEFFAPAKGITYDGGNHVKYSGYDLTVWKSDGSMSKTTKSSLSGSYTHVAGAKAVLSWRTVEWKTIEPFTTRFYSVVTVSGYDEGEFVENFQVLFRISETSPAGFKYENVQADGKDILFTDVNGTVIPHEIDEWNPEGVSYVWVTLPVMKKDAQFRFCYGNEELSDDGGSRHNIWDEAGCAAVWHFNDAVTDGTESAADATSNGNFATPTGASVAEMTRAEGAAGGARTIATSAVKNYFSVADSGSIDMGECFVMTCWLKASAANGRLACKKSSWSGVAGWEIEWRSSTLTSPIFWLRGSGEASSEGNATIPSMKDYWTHFAFVFDGRSARSYFNGTLAGSGSINGVFHDSTALKIGGSHGNIIGSIDETRLFKGNVDENRFKADYLTVADANFLSASEVNEVSRVNILTVECSSGESLEMTVPACGEYPGYAQGDEITFSAPSSVQMPEGSAKYRFTGYKLFVTGEDLVENLVRESSSLSGSYVHTAGTNVRLEWQVKTVSEITVTSGANGTVSPAGGYVVDGTVMNFLAVPEEGYRVKSWTTNGVEILKNSRECQLTVSGSDVDVTVQFEKIPEIAAYWDFSGKVSGEDASQFVLGNASAEFPCAGLAVGESGTKPVYSSHAPGTVIYRDSCGGGVFLRDPKSISLSNGTVKVTGLGNYITTNDAVTVECFVKLERTSSSAQWKSVWSADLDGESSEVHHVYSPALGMMETRLSCETGEHKSSLVNGPSKISRSHEAWHHIAVVYDAVESNATLYVDYKPSDSSLPLNIIPSEEGSDLPFYLGSGMARSTEWSNFNGFISCLRVSKGILDADDFMRVSYSEAASGDTLALFKFSGKAGKKALFLSNSAGERKLRAHAAVISDDANLPEYADEAPGEAIYPSFSSTNGLSRNRWEPLVRHPGSVRFPGVSGSLIVLEDLSSVATEGGSFTIEFFAKNEYDSSVTWKTVFCAQLKNSGNCPKLALPGSSGGQSATFQHFTYQRNAAIDHDSWHHVAIVYDAETGKIGGYVDYKIVMPFSAYAIEKTFAPVFIGGINDLTEPFSGLVSTLRMTKRALKPEEFMIAGPAPYKGLSIIIK